MRKYLIILFISIRSFCFAQNEMFFAQNVNPCPIPCPASGFGYLYNWYAASDVNFAPTGWHVPTSTEITTLQTYLGGTTSGGKLKDITYCCYWSSPNTDATNSSNFTALPGGHRSVVGGVFELMFNNGQFWCTDLHDDGIYGFTPYYFILYYNSNSFLIGHDAQVYGFSVRLMRTTNPGTSTITDYDGNTYDVVHIGTQYWTKQNWKSQHLKNGTSIPEVTDNTTWLATSTLARCVYNNDESLK